MHFIASTSDFCYILWYFCGYMTGLKIEKLYKKFKCINVFVILNMHIYVSNCIFDCALRICMHSLSLTFVFQNVFPLHYSIIFHFHGHSFDSFWISFQLQDRPKMFNGHTRSQPYLSFVICRIVIYFPWWNLHGRTKLIFSSRTGHRATQLRYHRYWIGSKAKCA